MQVSEINAKSVKKISDKELLNMHRRCHQLYHIYRKSFYQNKAKMIEKAHHDIVIEMKRRDMNHKSPLKYFHETIDNYI